MSRQTGTWQVEPTAPWAIRGRCPHCDARSYRWPANQPERINRWYTDHLKRKHNQ